MKKEYFVADMEEFFSNCADAAIQSQMGGLGGCKHFEITSFPARFQKYILQYIDDPDLSACGAFANYLESNTYFTFTE
jgi:hypothetical protein